MSTRCQVKIIPEKGISPNQEQAFMLYHHSDGYPSHMVPLIQKSAKNALRRDLAASYTGKSPADLPAFPCGRTGKVASMLCAEDPQGYEIENSLKLHGDIEYLYLLFVTPSPEPGRVRWELEIRTAHGLRNKDSFWNKPTISKLREIQSRIAIADINVEQVEKSEELTEDLNNAI